MGEVVELNKKQTLSETLRRLADLVESKELDDHSATIIIGNEIYSYSQDKLGLYGIVWDCNYAIQAIMTLH